MTRGHRRGRWLLVWSGAYLVAALLGRLTRPEGHALSLVWPAAGVAALWLLAPTEARTLRRSVRWDDALALVVVTVLVNLLTGADPAVSVDLALSNLAQAVTFAVVMRGLHRSVPTSGEDRVPLPGPWLQHVRDLEKLLLAAVCACVVGVVVGEVGLLSATGEAGWSSAAQWWCRNLAGLMMLAPLALLLADRHRLIPAATGPGRGRGLLVDWLVVLALTGLLVVLLATLSGGDAYAFILLFAVVVAGLRLDLIGVNAHAAGLAVLVVVATLAGRGPFAIPPQTTQRLFVAQAFLLLLIVVALMLSLHSDEHRRAVAELSESRQQDADRAALFAAVLENMREGVAVVQADGTVLARNPVGRRLLDLDGPPSPVVLGARDYGLHHADGTEVTDDELPFNRVLSGETTVSEDYVVFDPHGNRRILEVRGVRLDGLRPGDPARAVVSFRDVTAQRTERDNLAAFAGVVAHDLTSPLGVIRGWADTLAAEYEHGTLEASDGAAMVARIQAASVSMAQLIDDLLSYTVARDAALRLRTLDLSSVVEGVAALHAETADEPVITVQPRILVDGDPALVRQLFANLLGNAVKYVAPGVRPRIEVAARPAGDRVEITVSDNGIGVPAEARARIFENFQRAHADQAVYRGTGLGLAICRQVVERHGGTIAVEPGQHGGSVFRLTLPAPSSLTDPPQTGEQRGAAERMERR